MPQNFKFTFAYIQWYSEERAKWRYLSFDFSTGYWYDDEGNVRASIPEHIKAGATLYAGWYIKNIGDATGIPVFRLEDTDAGTNIIRVQKSTSLAAGSEWQDRKEFTMPARSVKAEYWACSYEDHSDYIHDKIPEYFWIFLFTEKTCEVRNLAVKDSAGTVVTNLYVGTPYTIEAQIGEVDGGFAPILGKWLNFYLDSKYLGADRSRADPLGYAIISYTPVAADIGTKILKAEHNADGTHKYCKEEISVTTFPKEGCAYTGFAHDAKIDHWEVPETAANGTTVNATVSVDNTAWPPFGTDPTRYRVKFTLDGGTPQYSDAFILDGYRYRAGIIPEDIEQEVPCTFVMPDHDVRLTVEIERCNASGNWENAGPDYKKEFTITLAVYPDAHGSIVREKTKPPDFAEKGKEIRIQTTIKNIGGKKGEFQMYLFDDTTDERIETEPCPRPLPCYWKDLNPGEEYSNTLDTDYWWGAMPDYDWPLRIEVRHQKTPDVVDDVYKFTVKLSGPAGHVLILDKIVSPLIIGTEYIFTGELTKEGVPVPNATIRIIDKDLIFGDFIAEGKTDTNGEFAIMWTVEKVEIAGKAEIYAYHPASGTKSSIQEVDIKKKSEYTMLLIYGAIAVGTYVGGTMIEGASPKMKVVGTALKVGTVIPAALAGYEGYKIIKEKIPFV